MSTVLLVYGGAFVLGFLWLVLCWYLLIRPSDTEAER